MRGSRGTAVPILFVVNGGYVMGLLTRLLRIGWSMPPAVAERIAGDLLADQCLPMMGGLLTAIAIASYAGILVPMVALGSRGRRVATRAV